MALWTRQTDDEPPIRSSVNDPERFGAVYDAYSRPILGYFVRRVLDPETAFDLHAELFARAFAQRRKFRGTTHAEEEAWLYTIARNLLSSYWQRGAVEGRMLSRLGVVRQELSDESLERVEELADLEPLKPSIAEALSSLPDEQRTAVELRVIHERSYADIAQQTTATTDLARQRVSRGLRALGRELRVPLEAAWEKSA